MSGSKKLNSNQYIPNFIATAPWYQTKDLNIEQQLEQEKSFRSRDDSKKIDIDLRHQRKDRNEKSKNFSIAQKGQGIQDLYREVREETDLQQKVNGKKRTLEDYYEASVKSKNKALKFKTLKMFKCSNCGSTKHNKADCLEKQKKVRIQYRSDKEIAKQIDENLKQKIVVRDEESLVNDYDAKRDNYYGYDDKEWEKQIKLKVQKNKDKEARNAENTGNAEEKNDEIDEDELMEMQELGILGSDKQDKLKTNNKNKIQGEKTIRLLEDRAKYLESVTAQEQNDDDDDDEEFVKKLTYNPKTRSFLDPKLGEFNEKNLFVRNLDGEAKEFEKLKQFSWNYKKNESNNDEDEEDEEAKRENNMMNRLASSPTAMMLELKKKKEKTMAKRKQFLSKYM